MINLPIKDFNGEGEFKPSDTFPLVCKAKFSHRKEQLHLVLLGLAAIFEGLVMVFSLGFLGSELRAWLLFGIGDLFDD